MSTETPQKIEESPPVDDDPNEVMGKSNIIYYNDIEADRKIPTRSIPLKEVELPVDKDVNPDDVEDKFEPQKGLTEEDKRELLEPEGVIPDPDFDKSLTYEDKVNQLLQECLDTNGNPLPKRRKTSKVKSFDINKYA